MSYFSDSAWKYFEKKIARSRLQNDNAADRKLLVMVPAMVESATLDLAETIANRCAADPALDLT